MYMQNKG